MIISNLRSRVTPPCRWPPTAQQRLLNILIGRTIASGRWARTTVTWHNKRPAQSDAIDNSVVVLSIPSWNRATRTKQNMTNCSTCRTDRSNKIHFENQDIASHRSIFGHLRPSRLFSPLSATMSWLGACPHQALPSRRQSPRPSLRPKVHQLPCVNWQASEVFYSVLAWLPSLPLSRTARFFLSTCYQYSTRLHWRSG